MKSPLEKLKSLVNRFKEEEVKFISSSSSYSESEARSEFIDPLFALLGWNMDNSGNLPMGMRDVVREESQLIETSIKKPDYTFRISTIRKFFTEAKRPSIDISTHKESALQVRSYGYTAGLPISILTNFRTLRIYDTRLEPSATDDADVGLILEINYKDFPSKIGYLRKVLGRNKVASGSIERTFGVTSTGTIPANASFLKRINDWRIRVGQDLHTRYPLLTCENLSDLAQKVINRIIFIRMCEDRWIEGEEMLRRAAKKLDFIKLRALFKEMDTRYNTGLFDVTHDPLQSTYEIDANLFLEIVNEVYAPNSPYSFSVLDADFLGQVYDLFLVQKLAFDSGTGMVILENKPTYERRDIVTTPQPLVGEVVRRAFESKFKQLSKHGTLTIDIIKSLRVLDIAVGSGRFLLRAFDELVIVVINTLLQAKDTTYLYKITDNNYRLAFEVKKAIMENCLFGIDIDYNAVEVARFSLMVKLLEDETGSTLPPGRKILPDLDKNIIQGNTVVGADFHATSGPVFDQTLPFDWAAAKLPVMFDVVVGNPPYIKTEEMKLTNPEEFEYLKLKYATPYKQFDKYFVFIELALSKMNPGGWLGLVVSNKWITIEAGMKLREMLAKYGLVAEIVNFGNELLFEGKSSYICLLVLTKDGTDQFAYRSVNSYRDFTLTPHDKGFILPSALLNTVGSNAWILPSSNEEAFILEKLIANSRPLSEVIDVKNGIQTSANDVFLIPQFIEGSNFITFNKNGREWKIEKDITRLYISDSSRVISYQPIVADARIIFPYEQKPNNQPTIINPSIMRKKYPLAFKYLTHHRPRLRKRKVSPPPKRGVFYAYGRHQSLNAVFTSPKIVYSVNQRGDKYAIDSAGVSYASGGTAGEVAVLNPKNGYSLEFFLGLLNQKAIEFFVRKRGSPFGNGYFSRGSAVLNDVPVPIIDIAGNSAHKAAHDAITIDVKTLITIQNDLQTASGSALRSLNLRRSTLLKKIESKFNMLWGFSNEVDLLRLPGDEG